MKLRILAAATLVVASVVSGADPVPSPAPAVVAQSPAADPAVTVPQTTPSTTAAVPAEACCKIPALTIIELEVMTAASSKTSKQGDRIKIRVIDAVKVNGQVAIPAGTEGSAEVIQASRGAFGGKAGELVIGLPYLTLNGQRIGLKRLRYGPASGRDRTNEAMWISAVAGGIFGMLDGGGNIDVQSGARANAVVTTETFVPVQPQGSSKE